MLAKQTAQKASTILIIGIGNDYRKDDAAGLLVARELRKQLPQRIQVLECSGACIELIDLWAGASVVVLVDAVASSAEPGTIYRLEVRNRPIPSYLFHYSTHDFNLAETIELARTLGKLPPKVVVFGIEGADFGQGEGLSEDMARATKWVIQSVLDYVHHCLAEAGEE